jgi:hypothetical protein
METTTRSQSVNFLGFLRGQLSGLQGIPTLCYELIQNADDVKDKEGNPAASKIIFDVCDDALYVENDGVFRDIDFERMQKVSWGDKREEAGTTGAFGIGFISVYQITDSPEIFSSGRHWIFHPEASENERIIEKQVETRHTRFRLPWAFEISKVREQLGISQVQKSQLDDFTQVMSEVIEIAALFLKQVTLLEVKRSGKSVRRIQTEREDDWLLVQDGNSVIRWRILEGNFALEAGEMRKKHGALIEEKRKSIVTIAIPEFVHDKGLLYAFLPSEMRTGLPFHINADFYPSSDRKRILFDVGYKTEWNNAAIQCAAETFAEKMDKVLEIFQPDQFWAMVENVKRASESNIVSPAFSSFWQELKQQVRVKPTVLTVGQKLLPPASTYYPRAKEHAEASNIFEELGLPIVHPSLYSHQNILIDTQVGVPILKLTNVARALKEAGVTERMELDRFPQPSLRTKEGWTIFLNALDALRESGSQQERFEGDILLKSCSIAFGEDGALWPPASLFQADQDTQEIFSSFSKITWLIKDENSGYLPASLVPRFGLQDGVKILEQNQAVLPALWQEGNYSPQKIYEWLESFQSEITNRHEVRESIRGLAIWPAAGLLKPINELYLAGDFEDPLHLARLVDIEELGGRSEFLENALRVEKLDFITYVRDWIPLALETNQLSSENRHSLIQVMAEYLGKLQGHEDLQEMLSELPLVWCGGEDFFPAEEVCFDSESIKDVLGPQVHIAFLPLERTEAVRAFYGWLGVAHEPRPADIMARIKDLTLSAPQPSSLKAIEKIFAHLANQWNNWSDGIKQSFIPLKKEKWLPGTKSANSWFDAANVYSIYQSYLFESQGNFLKIERAVQQKGSEFIKYLGIESEPLTEQVVKHLLYMSEQGKAVNQEIYVFLNRFSRDAAISLLRNKPCLYLKTEKGESYFRPDQVFWEEHPFGYFRSRLGPEFGRFKDLFDSLQVKSNPDAGDAIKVLLEISGEFGSSNTPLTDNKEVEDVVVMCWQILTTALEAEIIDSDTIQRELGNKKTIPDSRHILSKPITLLFEDRPGWGSKFELVKNNLIPRIEKAWGAMEAAGVQRISKAVTIDIHQCENPRENEDMKKRLSERKHLILRVIESHRAKGVTDFEMENLESLYFTQSDNIEIVRTFKGFNRVEPASLEKVDAIFLDDSLYFSSETNIPWIGIARELAYVLHPSGELSSLGMELKEILSQPSFDAASSILDEYGYPRIAIAIIAPVGSQEIIGLGGKDGINNTNIPERRGSESDNEDDTNDPGDSKSTTGSSTSPKGKKSTKPSDNRKSSRLVSYVLPKNPNSDHGDPDPNSEWATRRSQIGKIGVERVMEYERSQGRDPIDMETIQVNHPGYDITSVDESKKPRYIEVKSFTGIWDSQNPAQLTKKEFETAREKGDTFWLYVVENAETENFQIHCICNPAQQVDAYLFDHGWLNLGTNK